ncbi:hypothetical protein Tco_1359946 [Tanacetum coccineum]
MSSVPGQDGVRVIFMDTAYVDREDTPYWELVKRVFLSSLDADTPYLFLAGDGVASIKRRRRDQSSDDVRIMAMGSRRGRLKEDLESSTWRRRQEHKATPWR